MNRAGMIACVVVLAVVGMPTSPAAAPGQSSNTFCPGNLVADPIFDADAPEQFWDFSPSASTLLCSEDRCEDGYACLGERWVRFPPRMTTDVNSFGQSLRIPEAAQATLTYHYRASDETFGNLVVVVGDDEVHRLEFPVAHSNDGYVAQSIDLSRYADGNTYTLNFNNSWLSGAPLDVDAICLQVDAEVAPDDRVYYKDGSCADIPATVVFREGVIDGEPHVQFEAPLPRTDPEHPAGGNACEVVRVLGPPYLTVLPEEHRVELRFGPPQPDSMCLMYYAPVCTLEGAVQLSPGEWQFVSIHDGTIPGRPDFDAWYTVVGDTDEGEPAAEQPETLEVVAVGNTKIRKTTGDSVTFSVSATDKTLSLSYQWYHSPDGSTGESIPGAVHPDYTIPLITEQHQGLYQCKIQDDASGVYGWSPVFTLTLDELLPLSRAGMLVVLAAFTAVACAIVTRRRTRTSL